MIEHKHDQYSDEWYRARLGIPTASQFHNILTPTGMATRGDKRMKYMYRLIAERLLQQSMDDFAGSYWMKRAKALEQNAADAFIAGFPKWKLRTIGFCTTDDGKVGASPDRVLSPIKVATVANDEGVEIKCPSPWVQVEYLLKGPDTNYAPQVQGHMLVTGFSVVHLWVWHPQMPPVHVRMMRDDEYIEKLARELFVFCNELDVETERARRMGPYKIAELLRLSAEIKDDTAEFSGAYLQ